MLGGFFAEDGGIDVSRLSELMEEMCPDGVEYVRLVEAADYVRGLTYSRYDVVPEGLPVLRANNINLDNSLNFDDVKHVSLSVKDSLYLRRNDILICSCIRGVASVDAIQVESKRSYSIVGITYPDSR